MKRNVLALMGTLTVTVLAGCDDLPVSSVPVGDPGSPAFAIVDGANPDNLGDAESPVATANTFFLPPLVDDPVASGDATGEFDPTHRPVFRIVELADASLMCGENGGDRLVTEFTMDTGPGSEPIRMVPEDEHYLANWHTGAESYGLDSDCTYQIRVLTAGVTAATADVRIVSGPGNINTGEEIGLRDGGTLVIKVRIQEFCTDGQSTCTSGFIDPDEGGTVRLLDPDNDNLVAMLDCPTGCANDPFVLSLELLSDAANPSPDLGGNQFPYFVNALTVPDDVLLDGAVFTVCQTEEVQDDREGEGLPDASLRLFRVDDGVTDIREDSEGTVAPECAGFEGDGPVIGQATETGEVLFAGTPLQPVGTLLRRAAALIGPQPLGATSFLLHGGLNTVLRNETFSEWGATDVAQIETTVLVDGDGEEDVPVSVDAPSGNGDFDATGDTDASGMVLFEHLPVVQGDPLIDAPAPTYAVSIDENDLPAGVTCTTTGEDVTLDVPGETETVTFECTTLTGGVQDATGDADDNTSIGTSPDLVSASISGTGESALTFTVSFASGTMNQDSARVTFVLDTDQDTGTGFDGVDSGNNDSGLIGLDFQVTMGTPVGGSGVQVHAWDANGNSLGTTALPNAVLDFTADGMETTVPLSALGDDDGLMNFKVTTQHQLSPSGFTGILDYMPDLGLTPGTVSGPVIIE